MGNFLTKLSVNNFFCLSFLQAACFAFALGFCGSANLQLGPYCSRLIKINSMLVHSIKVIDWSLINIDCLHYMYSLILHKHAGRERLVEWKKDPLFPNATLYWNTIIYGIYHLPHFLQNAGHFKIDALLKVAYSILQAIKI